MRFDTLKNKIFDSALANTFKINGVTVSDKTGTGKMVLDTAPTLENPVFTLTGTASQALAASTDTALRVTNLAALKALTLRPKLVLMEGYYTAGDGGGGVFRWDSGSSTTANDGTVVTCTSGAAGRYKRLHDGSIHITWFGAVGDDSTNNTTVLNTVLSYCVSNRLEVVIPPGTFRFGSPLATLTGNDIVIRGSGMGQSILKYSGTNTFVVDGSSAGHLMTFESGRRITLKNFTIDSVNTLTCGYALSIYNYLDGEIDINVGNEDTYKLWNGIKLQSCVVFNMHSTRSCVDNIHMSTFNCIEIHTCDMFARGNFASHPNGRGYHIGGGTGGFYGENTIQLGCTIGCLIDNSLAYTSFTCDSHTTTTLDNLRSSEVLTGDTHSNTTLDNLSYTSGLRVGDKVTGSGIPANTTIAAINLVDGSTLYSKSVTLSQAATTTVGANTITITRNFDVSNLRVGMKIMGSGIPNNATIATIPSATSLTISAPATTSVTGLSTTVAHHAHSGNTTTAGSLDDTKTILGMPSTSGLGVGFKVIGSGIPADTYIAEILSGTSIKLTNAATAIATVMLVFLQGNYQIFFGTSTFDTNKSAACYIDDDVSGVVGKSISVQNGWFASTSQGNGFVVINWKNGSIDAPGMVSKNHISNGIVLNDPTTRFRIGAASSIESNGGYGISASNAITIDSTVEPYACVLGKFSSLVTRRTNTSITGILTVVNGSFTALPVGSGKVILINPTNGDVGEYNVGGGSVVMVSAGAGSWVSPTATPIATKSSVAWHAGSSTYRVYNAYGTDLSYLMHFDKIRDSV